MGELLSQTLVVEFPFTETDIGNTNSAGSSDTVHWTSMVDFENFLCLVELGTWNSSDDLDTCKLEQATSSAGAGKTDLTTSGSGSTYNYDTTYVVDADGDQVVLECHASDLDVAGGFKYVRVYLAETGNTGTDNVSAVYIKGGARIKRDELRVTAASAEKVYVKPS